MQYSTDELAEILKLHGMWRRAEPNGVRANLSDANLSGADLYGANLSGANLSRADLSRANLYGADLSRADLSDASLSRASLYGADLSRANLYGASLYGANLSGANLSDANLSGADLSGADHILRGPYLDGHEVFLVRFQDGPRYKAGCRWFTVAQAHEHWRDLSRHQREDAKRHCDLMLTGLAGLLEVGKLLGWEGCA